MANSFDSSVFVFFFSLMKGWQMGGSFFDFFSAESLSEKGRGT